MEYLHAQTRDSGSMVILANDKGALQALGDPDFLSRAERVALTPGASWCIGKEIYVLHNLTKLNTS